MGRIVINILSLFLAATLMGGTFVGWNVYENRNFEETFYTLSSDKIENHIRLIVIADLHQLSFGEENSKLLERTAALKPDAIMIPGDMIDRKNADVSFVLNLCEKLQEIAPVYYGFGNHENDTVYGADLTLDFLNEKNPAADKDGIADLLAMARDDRLIRGLREIGVQVIQNSCAEAEIRGNRIEIGGISTRTDSFQKYSEKYIESFAELPAFKVLLCHRPDVAMDCFADLAIDLVLSGHYHGGMVRIPGKGGMYGEEAGLFPPYDAGLFRKGGVTMIVSRGFAGVPLVPRILNKPELMIVDIY